MNTRVHSTLLRKSTRTNAIHIWRTLIAGDLTLIIWWHCRRTKQVSLVAVILSKNLKLEFPAWHNEKHFQFSAPLQPNFCGPHANFQTTMQWLQGISSSPLTCMFNSLAGSPCHRAEYSSTRHLLCLVTAAHRHLTAGQHQCQKPLPRAAWSHFALESWTSSRKGKKIKKVQQAKNKNHVEQICHGPRGSECAAIWESLLQSWKCYM